MRKKEKEVQEALILEMERQQCEKDGEDVKEEYVGDRS
jgi:hypothetical protein